MDEKGPSREERVRALQVAAETRVLVALRSIEEAQGLLDEACRALSSVRGMLIEWRKAGQLSDRARGLWYSVDRRAKALKARGRLLLDHEPADHQTQRNAPEGSEES